ncbi:MAG: class I SAM-dependent methyltransferase [Patescibacteria group bacterium]
MEIIGRVRVWIYDRAVAPMTATWYRKVLERLPPGCELLDVGIGTGSALMINTNLLIEKDIFVRGIDVDRAYIAHCRREVARRRLRGSIDARCESLYDHYGGPYDAIYFSGSFMLLPDPQAALRHARLLLMPGGQLYFTLTFEHQSSRFIERLKPWLRFLTTIDFGRVTYEYEFRKTLCGGGVALEELKVLHKGRRRSAILAIGRV